MLSEKKEQINQTLMSVREKEVSLIKKEVENKPKKAFEQYLAQHNGNHKNLLLKDFFLRKQNPQTIYKHDLSSGGKIMIVKKQSIAN